MEKKKVIKISLSTIIILFILVSIIIGMGFYISKLNKDKYYMTIGASQKIEELNNKIDDLEENLQKNSIKESVKLEEQFSSDDLGISFQYPSDWEIKDSYGFIEIVSPSPLVTINIKKERLNYSEELNYYKNDPWAMRIFEEGNTKVSNYNGYYFKSITGNGPDSYKQKIILIDLNNNEGFQISFSVSHDLYKLDSMDYSEEEMAEITKKQDKMYDEYEPIFSQIVSTLKF